MEILGHTIMVAEAAPTTDHAAKIELCPPPQDIKQLQHFLGMVNFYCRFMPNCAQVLCPLTDLLKGGAKTLEWTASAQEAFQGGKHLLAAAVPLQHPAPTAELSLATNAPIPKSEGSCSKNLETIGDLLDSFLAKQAWNLATPLLTRNCWQHSPQLGTFAIFVKDDLSNFTLITNHLSQL